MTAGGESFVGVIDSIDLGLVGGLGRLGRGIAGASVGALLLRGAKLGTSLFPADVVGRDPATAPPAASHGERPPTVGEAGGVPLSFSKFSNLERSEDTALIGEASGPFLEPLILVCGYS